MPTPHWAWPLPGQCPGEEPIENILAASRKGQAGGGGDHQGGQGNNRGDLTVPNCPSPSPAQLRALVYAPKNGSLLHHTGETAPITGWERRRWER